MVASMLRANSIYFSLPASLTRFIDVFELGMSLSRLNIKKPSSTQIKAIQRARRVRCQHATGLPSSPSQVEIYPISPFFPVKREGDSRKLSRFNQCLTTKEGRKAVSAKLSKVATVSISFLKVHISLLYFFDSDFDFFVPSGRRQPVSDATTKKYFLFLDSLSRRDDLSRFS